MKLRHAAALALVGWNVKKQVTRPRFPGSVW